MVGGGLSTDRMALRVCPPLLAIIVTVAGSGLGCVVTEIVSVDVPDPPVMTFVEKPVVIPPGALIARLTVPVNPLNEETVTVVVLDVPGGTVKKDGLTDTWKSWTVAVIGIVNEIPWLVPVILTVYAPAGVLEESDIVTTRESEPPADNVEVVVG